MDKPTHVSHTDLTAIQNAKANAAFVRLSADKAMVERRVAELEAKNVILMAYVKYGLSSNDTIDNEGKIVRSSESEEVIDAPQPYEES